MKYAVKAKLFLLAVILALFAASFAFLVEKPATRRPAPATNEVKKEQAKLVIEGFYANNEGENESWELKAKRAEMKEEGGLARLQDLDATYNSRDGKGLTLKADEGTYDSGSKAVTLVGKEKDVTVTSDSGYRISARDMRWDNSKKELSTGDRVKVEGKNIRIEGKGCVARTDLEQLRITDGVKTVFETK